MSAINQNTINKEYSNEAVQSHLERFGTCSSSIKKNSYATPLWLTSPLT